ncbi:MAG: GNAT family N-acetyltransferase [bacterium]|jgi:hypothetical protein|nr:GNAT family N-acetyltransferase [bacterium]MDD3625020.1 GNAT family N-acetyltransferase [Proteiniphilum sp.]MDD3968004.1 GNAT family N-acetyltransferase [Proteiniphilum sp.]MDD4459349.1 GNAT family N-acetyltransferase [Proteiniphilum sp.]
MEIQFKMDEKKRGSFFIEQGGRQIAELEFQVKENLLNAYHTGVRPELEGQGIAALLFDRMVSFAREKGYKVIPACSYILVKFRRHPDAYDDIWHRMEDEASGEACGIRPKDN